MEKDTLFSGGAFNVEYKVAVPKDSAKYMKTVVAYANGCGGKIIFGVEDKTVIVVEIFPGKMRPYYIKSKGMASGTYVRSAGTTRPVADYMLKELILEGHGDPQYSDRR